MIPIEKQKRYYEIPLLRYACCGSRPGMQRSDEEIKGDLLNRMVLDRRINLVNVLVTVRGGVVTLSGVVENEQERRCADETARRTPGVVGVHNELQIRTVDGLESI